MLFDWRKSMYILILIFGGFSSQSGYAVIQQEFYSLERCEAARVEIAKAHNGFPVILRSQGCYKK